MAKPAIVVVDDDAQVLRALERDLRHKYGSTYRVVRSASADAAGPDLVRDGRRPRGFEHDPFLLETSVPGIFVAGDVRSSSVKRVASSVGECSIAIQFVHRYLATL